MAPFDVKQVLEDPCIEVTHSGARVSRISLWAREAYHLRSRITLFANERPAAKVDDRCRDSSTLDARSLIAQTQKPRGI